MRKSRLLGALVGGGLGVLAGILGTVYLYGNDPAVAWSARLLAGLVVGLLGAGLGSLSGISGAP
jgi:hypothetical protein